MHVMHARSLVARAAALTLLVALVAPVAVLAAAPAHFPSTIALPDGWQPEGITAGRGATVYAGSLADGSVREVNVRTGAQRTLVSGPGTPAVGVEYDRAANRLWVAGGPSGEVRVYDATTGAHLRTYTFPVSGFLNDLVVTRRGVYVTDSFIQELKVIPLGPGGSLPPESAATTLPLGGDISFVPGEFNANGIVARGGWLVLVQSNTGQLFRVDPATGVGTAIDLGGETVTFGDGLELSGRTLWVVRNQQNRVAIVRLSGNLLSGELAGHIAFGALDVPTTVAFQNGRLWAVNARFGTTPTPDTEYWITRLPARR